MIIKIGFFTAGFFLLTIFLLYPMVLSLLSKVISKNGSRLASDDKNMELSKISVIVSAYNEDEVIEERINNILSLDYPQDKIELIVVDDCSNDGTYDIVQKYGNQMPGRVKFLANEERMGKAASLNRAVRQADGDILLMTDANTMFEKGVAKNLEKHFRNHKIGAARGALVIRDKNDSLIPVLSESETTYWNMDMKMAMDEWSLGSCINMPGAIYAIRKELYKEIPEDRTIMDDFYESINVLKKGFVIACEKDAVAYEYNSADKMGEYKRKIRISVANFNIVRETLGMLNFFKYKQISFFVFCHKILRWYSFVFFAVFILSSMALAYFSRDLFYSVVFFLLILFFYFATIGFLFDNIKIKLLRKICGISLYFLSVNIAQFQGFKMSLKSTNPYWERIKRQS